MDKDLLKKAFNSQDFRTNGHLLIDLLADHLEDSFLEKKTTNNYNHPDIKYNFWKNYPSEGINEAQFFKDVLNHSIKLHNPKYMGHQVAATAPIAALTGLMVDLLNNGNAVFEMGPSAAVVERIIIEKFNHQIGFKKRDGFFTSGGTLANLTALLAARKAKATQDIWEIGHSEKLGVLVSTEAHYCIDRAIRIMGWGSDGVVKVPVDAHFKMRVDLLEKHYQEAKEKGIKIIAVVVSAPSTSTGKYDDFKTVAHFCEKYNLWMHVDGAHGGPAIFSDKYKNLMAGVERADSVVIDAHKMMLVPALATVLLFKSKVSSYQNFQLKAQYLWEKSGEKDWSNLAVRTFECTKQSYVLKLFVLMKIYGMDLFSQFIDYTYDLAREFAEVLIKKNNFKLAVFPDSNIVCFKYFDATISTHENDTLNVKIRKKILLENEFYIVQTSLHGKPWLRVSLMNPKTEIVHLEQLLDSIESKAKVFLQ